MTKPILSAYEIKVLRCALGLHDGNYTVYRNRFYASNTGPDFALWTSLIERGLAIKAQKQPDSDMTLFMVRQAGVDAVIKRRESVDPEEQATLVRIEKGAA